MNKSVKNEKNHDTKRQWAPCGTAPGKSLVIFFSRHRGLYWEIKEEADQQLKTSSAITASVPQRSEEVMTLNVVLHQNRDRERLCRFESNEGGKVKQGQTLGDGEVRTCFTGIYTSLLWRRRWSVRNTLGLFLRCVVDKFWPAQGLLRTWNLSMPDFSILMLVSWLLN